MTLEELLDIDARKFYRVIFCCSQYGPLFKTRELAQEALDKFVKYNEIEYANSYIEELNGWQEEINEDNGVEYIEAAMAIIKKLKSDLEISHKLVLELLEQIVETEERYE